MTCLRIEITLPVPPLQPAWCRDVTHGLLLADIYQIFGRRCSSTNGSFSDISGDLRPDNGHPIAVTAAIFLHDKVQ
jgi:hypothetical protein